MIAHPRHRFSVSCDIGQIWVMLTQEQYGAVTSGERRVIEGPPRIAASGLLLPRWYFNESGFGLLRIEIVSGGIAPDAVIWEGRSYDAYVGESVADLG